jgi:hypothetical protein
MDALAVTKALAYLLHQGRGYLNIAPGATPVGRPRNPAADAISRSQLFPWELAKDNQFGYLPVRSVRVSHWVNLQQGMLSVAQEDIDQERVVFNDPEMPVVSADFHRRARLILADDGNMSPLPAYSKQISRLQKAAA